MRSNFFWTARRMAVAGTVVLVALIVGLPLLPPVLGDWSRVVRVAVLVLVVVAMLFLVDRIQHRQAGIVAARVSGTRPGGTVVPVVALARSRAVGETLGLPTAGHLAVGGSPGALVILRDRVELWIGPDGAQERWSARPADVHATAGTVTAGRRTWPAASITDGDVALAVAPRYTAAPRRTVDDVERLVRALREAGS